MLFPIFRALIGNDTMMHRFNEVCLPKGLMWRVSYVETWLEGQSIWLEGNICPWASQSKWPKTMRAQTAFGSV